MTKPIKEKECKELTGLSRMTRWRLIKADKFPKPFKLDNKSNVWLESDIHEWIKSRIKSS
jgi:prophage regulatory protein